jgi:hypothetical protein
MKQQINEIKRMQQLAGILKESQSNENNEFQADMSKEGLGLLLGDLYHGILEYFIKEEDSIDEYLEEFENEAPKYKEIWNELPQQFTILPEPDYDEGPMNIMKTETGFKTDFWDK